MRIGTVRQRQSDFSWLEGEDKVYSLFMPTLRILVIEEFKYTKKMLLGLVY